MHKPSPKAGLPWLPLRLSWPTLLASASAFVLGAMAVVWVAGLNRPPTLVVAPPPTQDDAAGTRWFEDRVTIGLKAAPWRSKRKNAGFSARSTHF